MPAALKDLREKRGRVVEEMKKISDVALSEKRGMSAEEEAKHKQLFEEQDNLRRTIDAAQRQAEIDKEMASAQYGDEARTRPAGGKAGGDSSALEERKAIGFRRYLVQGMADLTSDDERRDLGQTSNPDGGYLVAPMQFTNELIKKLDDTVHIRRLARKFTFPGAASLGAPSLDEDVSDADWTTEVGLVQNDTAMKFGRRELATTPIRKLVKVARKLLGNATNSNVEALVIERLNYKFGITHEKAFLTGDGNKKPLGVFTASPAGIPVGRDIQAGNTTTSITFDGLIGAKYALKEGYHRNAQWLFHRNALEQVSKLKDSEGQYIWRASVLEDEPDRILNHPVNMSEYVPNVFTTGLYVGIIGDFSQYWILDSTVFEVQRLNELYAQNDQIGYIAKLESDGMPVQSEAFARVRLA